MSNSPIDTNFIKAMLISPSGTVINGYNVGNWFFNRSLLYSEEEKTTISGHGKNLTEILWKIERGISNFKIIPEINNCNYKASSDIYYKVKEKVNIFWKDGTDTRRVIQDRFWIPVEHFDEFCSIVADSFNTIYFS